MRKGDQPITDFVPKLIPIGCDPFDYGKFDFAFLDYCGEVFNDIRKSEIVNFLKLMMMPNGIVGVTTMNDNRKVSDQQIFNYIQSGTSLKLSLKKIHSYLNANTRMVLIIFSVG
jgi:hypothetical protein